jgi:hypothetical protein
MIEKVLHRVNLLKAYRQVLANKGAAGVDGMPVSKLSEHLQTSRVELQQFTGGFLLGSYCIFKV